MNPDTASLLTDRVLITGAIFLGGIVLCVFVTIWIVIDSRHKAAEARNREETRREIAAYVAEGSMTVEDATKLLTAGGSIGHRIMNELGEFKRSGEARRTAAERTADEGLKPQTT